MTEPPSAIVAGQLVLTQRGAVILLAALELALRHAPPGYQGRTRWDDVAWVREQARLVAQARTGPAGSAGGTGPVPWRLDVPDSRSIISTGDAAVILGVSARAVVKRIEAGDLPATRVGRTWALLELDVRTHAAGNGRHDVDDTETVELPGPPPGRFPDPVHPAGRDPDRGRRRSSREGASSEP